MKVNMDVGLMMRDDQKLLAKLTRIILDEKQDGKTLRPEVHAIKDIFERLCEDFRPGENAFEFDETRTEQGLAISPAMAAMCLEDYYRTIIYLRGLNAAILKTQTKHPSRALRVFYAGSGPYAILAIPLMAIYGPEIVTFEILDIHAISLENARSIITQLDLTESVSAFHYMDAMDYTPNEKARPDIIIAEVMLSGLETEPQVAVTRALTTQMPDALFLPQSIDISAVTDEPKQSLGPVFSFHKEMFTATADENNTLPAMSINVPKGLNGHIFLETRVKVYGHHILEPYDSGLTSRRILPCDYKEGETLSLVYQMGEKPGLIRVHKA